MPRAATQRPAKRRTAHRPKWMGRLVSVVGALLLAHITFLVVGGEKGFLTHLTMQQELEEAQISLELVMAERLLLEQRVQSMRSESLDTDLLEEMSKKQLGLRMAGEVVWMDPAAQPQ